MARNIIIYTLAHPITLEVRYVGKTSTSLNLRYNTHVDKSKHKRTHKDCWIQSLLAKGLKPVLEILEECDEDNWIEREVYWISQMKTWGFNLVNHTEGGEGHSGYKKGPMSEEQKRKISESKKGIRTIIIDFTDEVRAKIGKSKMKPVSKLSESGERLEDFNSLSEAAESIGISISAISKCLRNEKYTAGGFKWSYKNSN